MHYLFKNYFYLGLFTLLFSHCIFAQPEDSGNFEKPNRITQKITSKSATPEQNIVEKCYIYADFVILETNDPNSMGPENLMIRPINTKNVNLDLCDKNVKSNSYILKPTGYFKGKYANLIYTQGPDCFGAYCAFKIYRITKQRFQPILDGSTGSDKNIQFSTAQNGITGMDYWMGLESTTACSLAAKNKADCWKTILHRNKIKEILPIPDCAKTYAEHQTPLDDPSQVLLHVAISDLKHPHNIKIINEQAECYPQP